MQKYLPISKKSSTFAPAFRKKACPGGGIGRRVGLKHQCLWRTGSIPVLGTKKILYNLDC